jgi:hypothetical protein
MSKRTFYAAKINIHANIFSQDLEELINHHIPRVILESKPLKVNTWNWTFTDVDSIDFENQRLIIGNVTKSKHTNQTIRIGQKTTKVKSEHELAHRSFFVYDPEGEILVHESTSAITAHEFRVLFTRLLSIDPYVGEVVINPIPVPHVIRKEIMAIENITKIHFHLIHPNPGREEFNLYQDIIKENGLKELNVEMVNKDGFKIADVSTTKSFQFKKSIESGIALVESGYGDILIKGFNKALRQGKRKKIIDKKKRSFSSSMSVRLIKTNELDSKRLLSRIFSFILDVKGKVLKDGEGDEEK